MMYEKISQDLVDLRNRGAIVVDAIVSFSTEAAMAEFADDCFHIMERSNLGGTPTAVGHLKTSGFDALENDPRVVQVSPNIRFHIQSGGIRVEDDVQ